MQPDEERSTAAEGAKRSRFQISDLDFELPVVPSAEAGSSEDREEKETKVSAGAPGPKAETHVFVAQPEELESIGFLYCRTGLRKGQLQQLKKRRNEFGRALDCDFVVEDDHVSAHHGAVLLDGGVWKAFDFASANGTYVNGKRLGSDATNPIELQDDDAIQLGKSEFVFKQIQI